MPSKRIRMSVVPFQACPHEALAIVIGDKLNTRLTRPQCSRSGCDGHVSGHAARLSYNPSSVPAIYRAWIHQGQSGLLERHAGINEGWIAPGIQAEGEAQDQILLRSPHIACIETTKPNPSHDNSIDAILQTRHGSNDYRIIVAASRKVQPMTLYDSKILARGRCRTRLILYRRPISCSEVFNSVRISLLCENSANVLYQTSSNIRQRQSSVHIL